VEDAAYYDHEGFRPWRLFAPRCFKSSEETAAGLRDLGATFALRVLRRTGPAIDVINGSDLLRSLGLDDSGGDAGRFWRRLTARDEGPLAAARARVSAPLLRVFGTMALIWK